MKYYTIGQFSKLVGKSIQTLRLWGNKGILKPHHTTEGGHQYYSEQQINQVLQVPLIKKDKRMIKELLENDTGE
ncbi:MerR HTH family regulatory protein [Clostridium pasteurianum DSM 525 = ATCC 6013]|uniref:MerR HTH family regulatory protein n=1 Tax=Clostridium pasteurianum DSM 525 = ATCC 6013 TaxID=1262449 RepID=A0A0H3J1H7_CLOPA|nr:MerR family transcriptional regulator [Clostridium pasteurianum]AJA47736.1 MerR HTH family regulatory protein [Clostridium pasteurianum DSM 525 = ATCC 6013]AJA51724.1 MerR HTH family regulatory protein [Clostridium pasteurianum DSM 525 = ATCC 6013]ELP59638.1 transposon, resolvase [Clostridium pasteurianum DSM 525 = ATCC 6013]KRU12268.1 transcriptional regulator, MerR family [Clostridium pasteurianum DSM 525 = ATCC 6013]UZW15899.1 MerR family transcriptional regulator [Clostridium pasteurian